MERLGTPVEEVKGARENLEVATSRNREVKQMKLSNPSEMKSGKKAEEPKSI